MAGSYFNNWLLLVLNRKRNQIHRVSRKFEHEKRRKREKKKGVRTDECLEGQIFKNRIDGFDLTRPAKILLKTEI